MSSKTKHNIKDIFVGVITSIFWLTANVVVFSFPIFFLVQDSIIPDDYPLSYKIFSYVFSLASIFLSSFAVIVYRYKAKHNVKRSVAEDRTSLSDVLWPTGIVYILLLVLKDLFNYHFL